MTRDIQRNAPNDANSNLNAHQISRQLSLVPLGSLDDDILAALEGVHEDTQEARLGQKLKGDYNFLKDAKSGLVFGIPLAEQTPQESPSLIVIFPRDLCLGREITDQPTKALVKETLGEHVKNYREISGTVDAGTMKFSIWPALNTGSQDSFTSRIALVELKNQDDIFKCIDDCRSNFSKCMAEIRSKEVIEAREIDHAHDSLAQIKSLQQLASQGEVRINHVVAAITNAMGLGTVIQGMEAVMNQTRPAYVPDMKLPISIPTFPGICAVSAYEPDRNLRITISAIQADRAYANPVTLIKTVPTCYSVGCSFGNPISLGNLKGLLDGLKYDNYGESIDGTHGGLNDKSPNENPVTNAVIPFFDALEATRFLARVLKRPNYASLV